MGARPYLAPCAHMCTKLKVYLHRNKANHGETPKLQYPNHLAPQHSTAMVDSMGRTYFSPFHGITKSRQPHIPQNQPTRAAVVYQWQSNGSHIHIFSWLYLGALYITPRPTLSSNTDTDGSSTSSAVFDQPNKEYEKEGSVTSALSSKGAGRR